MLANTTLVMHEITSSSIGRFIAVANPINAVIRLFTHPKLQDYFGILVLGIMAEITRRLLVINMPWLESLVTVKAIHTTLDDSHNWIMAFWMSHPDWQAKTRHFSTEVSFISAHVRSMPWVNNWGKKGSSVMDKRKPPRPRLLPPQQSSFTIWYKGRLVRLIRRGPTTSGEKPFAEDDLVVQIIGGTVQLYKELLAEAKQKFQADDQDYIAVKMIDPSVDGGGWKQIAQRHKRGLNTIISEDGVAETVCNDMKEFLQSSDWYADRGIPYRRGFLLHGVPGSGKTSCIHAAASELDLEIYIVALATSGLTDSTLISAMSTLPREAVVVFEDIDAALPSDNASLTRKKLAKSPEDAAKSDSKNDAENEDGKGGRVTLSGILNSIDGIGGGDGRVLFMTSNDISKLDPALIRPGRCDRQFRFENASQDQARRMFEKFYNCKPPRRTGLTEKPTVTSVPEELQELATDFATKIPDRLLSTAAIQGHLMLYKASPKDAVATVCALVQEKQTAKAKKEAVEANKQGYNPEVPV